ncbi:hydrolase [Bradyrhizobium ontarionense]|uniref:Hydrolase n=1 Tax=Bradyrhizobium ontarionense TaxID=2898149 RepID=A0ABY3RAZ8_9BRAD|nr:hydrolase [Bradyrhizobium sp. A19]UFZ04423.1 hydrolase [Bradyrhizobium sp. A19]
MNDQPQPRAELPPRDLTRRYCMGVLAAAAVAGYLPPIGLFHAARPFGASATLKDLAQSQRDHPEQIVLPFDLRYNAAFKLARVEQEHPEIIWISTSRAGTFRAALFAPYRFYNLSFTAWTTGQMADLFERATRQAPPRIAILSLDHFLFAERWEEWFALPRKMYHDRALSYVRSSLLDFARTATRHPAPFRNYLNAPTAFIGTQSIFHEEGFRDDGSYLYSPGHVADARSRYMNAETLAETLPRASGLSSWLKQPIMRLAEIAEARGVKLLGIQLPFIRAGVDLLDREQAGPLGFGAWREFAAKETRNWLREIGIPFFDLARLPMEDETASFVDAYHLAESGAARVMLHLLNDPDFRAEFPRIDAAEIQHSLAALPKS